MSPFVPRRLRLTTIVACLSIAVVFSLEGCSSQLLQLMERQVTANFEADPVGDLADGLHVLVCGAGGPLPAENRTPACLLVIAGETVMLFDVGGGAARTMAMNGFPPPLVERVFLTHFHSDHIDGLGEVATLRWAGGDWKTPLAVHGPTGVAEVVDGFNGAYRLDQHYREVHHGPKVTPPGAAGLMAEPFAPPALGTAPIVFERGALRVKAFAVDHEPVSPAVGYRVEYKDRSISISGDTAYSENLVAQSSGVDVMLHEALSKRMVRVMNQAAGNAGNAIMAKITADILDYHATPVEAAQSAATAKARSLVVYHVVPPLPIAVLERVFREGMDDAYDGPIEIAVDGTFVSLPASSRAIEIDSP